MKPVLLSEFDEAAQNERERVRALLDSIEKCEASKAICNVCFSVSDGSETVEIGSSQSHLAVKSGYFAAMFEGDSEWSLSEPVSLPKVSAVGMRAINAIAFDCYHSVSVATDTVAELLCTAQHCDVSVLSEMCRSFLKRLSKEGTMDDKLSVASELFRVGLSADGRKFLDSMPDLIADLFESETASDLSEDLFTAMVDSDELCASEDEVWNVSQQWAEKQSEMSGGERDSLYFMRKLKPFIRFPLLSHRT